MNWRIRQDSSSKRSARMLLGIWLVLMLVSVALLAGCSTAPRVSVSPAVLVPPPKLPPPPAELMEKPPPPGWFHDRVQRIFQAPPSDANGSAGK